MKIYFEDAALEELYISGATSSNQYRKLAKDVIKQYVKVVNYIRAARRIEDRAPAARGLGNMSPIR